jgi:DNA-binding NtrC family response regulator
VHTILVADDEPAIRRIIVRRILTLYPTCTILETADGQQALALLATPNLSGVITDYMMPGATGLDVLLAARAHVPELPVIVISAHATLGTAVMAHGASAFLSKPFTLEQLDAALRLFMQP